MSVMKVTPVCQDRRVGQGVSRGGEIGLVYRVNEGVSRHEYRSYEGENDTDHQRKSRVSDCHTRPLVPVSWRGLGNPQVPLSLRLGTISPIAIRDIVASARISASPAASARTDIRDAATEPPFDRTVPVHDAGRPLGLTGRRGHRVGCRDRPRASPRARRRCLGDRIGATGWRCA